MFALSFEFRVKAFADICSMPANAVWIVDAYKAILWPSMGFKMLRISVKRLVERLRLENASRVSFVMVLLEQFCKLARNGLGIPHCFMV